MRPILTRIICLGMAITALTTLAMHAAAELDPRGDAELQAIILLCATEPGSAKFNAKWTSWVRANPEVELQDAVDTIASRAGSIRSMMLPGIEPARPTKNPDRDAVADYMLRVGHAVRVRPISSRQSDAITFGVSKSQPD